MVILTHLHRDLATINFQVPSMPSRTSLPISGIHKSEDWLAIPLLSAALLYFIGEGKLNQLDLSI